MSKLLYKHLVRLREHYLILILLAAFTFIFFYRLGWAPLASWDEAWYGSIAREIVKTGDLMYLKWNGVTFVDHPPAGFWLMALSYKLFGISEFATRLPSALLGVLSILIIYLVGIELTKNKFVGAAASLVLGTSVWYVLRVRSGNLDSILVFFYLLTILLALKTSKNFKLFPYLMGAFAFLNLSKTLVGFSAALLILIILNKKLFTLKNLRELIMGIVIFSLIALPWYVVQFLTYPHFFENHFVRIGMRNRTWQSYLNFFPQQNLFYLHMGVRKWFNIWQIATPLLLVFGLKNYKKTVAFLLFWAFIIFYPFLTSELSEIWHLIPVYLPLSLITASGFYFAGDFFSNWFKLKYKKNEFIKRVFDKKVVNLAYIAAFIFVAVIQYKVFAPEIFPQNKYVNDEADISKRAAKYSQKLYLDDDFMPVAVFYSNKKVKKVQDIGRMVDLFRSKEKNFIVITRSWAVDNLVVEKIPYKVLEKNNSFTIISR